jgi:hypothetical protein
MKRSLAIAVLLLTLGCATRRLERIRYQPTTANEGTASQASARGQIAGHAWLNDRWTADPLPGTTVTLFGPDNKQRATVVADISGSFQFRNLQPGLYSIRLELAGLPTRERPIVVLAEQTANVDTMLTTSGMNVVCTIAFPIHPPAGTTLVYQAPDPCGTPWGLSPAIP